VFLYQHRHGGLILFCLLYRVNKFGGFGFWYGHGYFLQMGKTMGEAGAITMLRTFVGGLGLGCNRKEFAWRSARFWASVFIAAVSLVG